MKKKTPSNVDVGKTMLQIQEQLAALDSKLDAFINKSLTDLAQALATQKAAVAPRPVVQPPAPIRAPEPPRRPMYAIVCYQCGKDCEIPFKPTPGRPVYCPECFAQKKAGQLQPKVNLEVKPVVEVKAPVQVVPLAKAKKKAPVAKKAVLKKAKKKSAKK